MNRTLLILFYEQGDAAQAVVQENRALAIHEQCDDPKDRANSHDNLAVYLNSCRGASTAGNAPSHRLGSLTYRLAAKLWQDLELSLNNYAFDFRRAHTAGTELAVLRLSDLLADPAFEPLKRWLAERQVDLDDLQGQVDQFLDQARQAALS